MGGWNRVCRCLDESFGAGWENCSGTGLTSLGAFVIVLWPFSFWALSMDVGLQGVLGLGVFWARVCSEDLRHVSDSPDSPCLGGRHTFAVAGLVGV